MSHSDRPKTTEERAALAKVLSGKCDCWCHKPGQGPDKVGWSTCAACCAKGKGEVKSFTTFEPKCMHNGEVPVMIGGHPVHLTGSYMVTDKALEGASICIPLNGNLPSKLWLGQFLPLVVCSLTDHGGVPDGWDVFIGNIAEYIKKGLKTIAWCHGSHGRTGCFAASLIAVMEPETADPIAAIRERHCKSAVESLAQAKAVFALRGLPLPELYKKEFAPKPVASYSSPGSYSGGLKRRRSPKDASWEYYHHYQCKCNKCKQSSWMSEPCLCDDRTCIFYRKILDAAAIAQPPAPPKKGTHGWYCICDVCMDEETKGHKHKEGDLKCNCRPCNIAGKLFYVRELRAQSQCLDCWQPTESCKCAEDDVTCKTCLDVACACACGVPPVGNCHCVYAEGLPPEKCKLWCTPTWTSPACNVCPKKDKALPAPTTHSGTPAIVIAAGAAEGSFDDKPHVLGGADTSNHDKACACRACEHTRDVDAAIAEAYTGGWGGYPC